ncbi:MAG: phosphatidylglycerophosphatase A [Methanobacteriaceae archaeon]|nr:phosphatidylglycerophosphatase A [Methanobacteriaceae archaeon]
MENVIEGVDLVKTDDGLIVKSKEDLYILGNLDGYCFKYHDSFQNHYNDFANEFHPGIVVEDDMCAIVTIDYIKSSFFINASLIIDAKLDNNMMLNIFRIITESISTSLWDVDAISKNKLDNQLGNFYNISFVACKGENKNTVSPDLSLNYSVKTVISKAVKKALANFGYPKDIMGFIEGIGVTLDDMVEAGMELIVDVDPEEYDKLKDKLAKQIIHSLKDINVVSYLIAAIRLEEDYDHYRIKGINVDDDPAYLYMDEIMGMAIANQISGTKAIFNFTIYDKKKPGILSKLGPSVDDIIGGLIAGCVSKIFEDNLNFDE